MALIHPTRAGELGHMMTALFIIPTLGTQWFVFHWRKELLHYPGHHDQINDFARVRLRDINNRTFHHSPQDIRRTVSRGMALIYHMIKC